MIRSFLPAGQGAFYCECFSEHEQSGNDKGRLNVVYDCGSSTSTGLVEEAVRHNFTEGEEIQALFISHLHEDHMNGIPFLMKYCKVRKIFFPLVAQENRAIIEIGLEIGDASEFTRAFFRDPRRAVRSLNTGYDAEIIQIEEYDRDPTIMDFIVDGETARRSSGENVSGEIAGWSYVPFNFRQKSRITQLMKHLKSQFGRKITEDELQRLWKNSEADRDKIKSAYHSVSGTMNTNSMTLFSGTDSPTAKQQIYRSYVRCGCPCPEDYKEAGCLYLGDYDASGKEKWKQLKSAYGKYWSDIGCVQVPHHGSRENFHAELLGMDAFFVISAGVNNKYRHPHPSVMKSFLLEGIMPFLVTERPGSAFYTSVTDW